MLHELFERQAAQTPDAPALWALGEDRITYRELDRRANDLALRLSDAGVAPRTYVGLLASTGSLHVTAMLATLKCGAAFVTLDVDEPVARQMSVIRKLSPSAVLFDPDLADAASRLEEVDARLPITWTDHEGDRVVRPRVARCSPADTAFIAFTSGSTGRPKGIVQSHRSFCQFLAWFGTTFDFGPGTRLAQWAAATYDAAYCEIFGGLLYGATVCLVPRHARNDPAEFLAWAARSQITVLELVPSYAAQLLAESRLTGKRAWDELRYVLLAGEELNVALARGLLEVFSAHAELYNLYGPSECVLATYHRVNQRDLVADCIPVGRPIDGRTIIVRDETGKECGVGVVGEICVRSAFLANGYLHDEALTAAVFADVSTSGPAELTRELRTGDLGQWRTLCDLEWLGRRDRMVKRRGVRIEMEEVERRLLEISEIAECAVSVMHPDDSTEGNLLVAHIVLMPDAAVSERSATADHIRRRATQVLPTQLIPDTFCLTPILPRLPNGKLDRSALAAIAIKVPASDAGDEKRELTPTEQQVASIYSNVLGLAVVDSGDNFFDLGGHSLLAMTVLDRVRACTGLDLPVLTIFEHPTVRQLAALVDSQPAADIPRPVLTSRSWRNEYPLTPGQEALWLADCLRPGNPAYSVPIVTSIRGQVEVGALEESVRRLISRHDVLRSAYRFDGHGPVCTIAAEVTSSLLVVDITTLPIQRKAHVAESAVRDMIDAPFALGKPGLIRSSLTIIDDHNYILSLAMHHIVCDELGLYVLADDLAALYAAATLGTSVPEVSDIRFADFVTEWLPSNDRQEGSADPPPSRSSAAQLRRRARQVPADRIRGVLGSRQASTVRTLAARTQATLFTTLLACAGAALVSAGSNDDTIVIDVPISRRRAEFFHCVGCFIDTVRVRYGPDQGAAFRQRLASTHSQLASAGSSGLDGRSGTESSALFTLHMGGVPYIQLADLACAPYLVDRNTAKSDLGIYWRDDGIALSYIVEYATDVYSRQDAESFMARYLDLIAQACADPDEPLAGSRRPQ